MRNYINLSGVNPRIKIQRLPQSEIQPYGFFKGQIKHTDTYILSKMKLQFNPGNDKRNNVGIVLLMSHKIICMEHYYK